MINPCSYNVIRDWCCSRAFREDDKLQRLDLMNMKQYRSEWKYVSHTSVLSQVKSRISSVMDLDPHSGKKDCYSVHSLYFDDPRNTCARENIAGEGQRFKYRIRYYDRFNGFLMLEKKEKKNSFCHKRSCRIGLEEYHALLNGDPGDLLYNGGSDLLREFSIDIISKGFMPKAIINYEREAFVEPISNVRITFDSDVTSSDLFDDFLKQGFGVPVLPDKQQILEVKFDEILPSYIRKIIEEQPLTQQSFSKYYMGRMTLQDFYRI